MQWGPAHPVVLHALEFCKDGGRIGVLNAVGSLHTEDPTCPGYAHMLDPHCLPQPWGLWVGSRAWRTQHPATWGPCPLGANPAVPTAWPRYRIVGTADSGQYNLEISDAELSDDAVYECQATEAALRSRRAKLTVLSKEQTPQPSLIPWVLPPPPPL